MSMGHLVWRGLRIGAGLFGALLAAALLLALTAPVPAKNGARAQAPAPPPHLVPAATISANEPPGLEHPRPGTHAHPHPHPQTDALADVPPAPLDRGRLNPIALSGATFRAQVVEDRLLVRARPGAAANRREIERSLAAEGMTIERFEPALELFTVSIRTHERVAAVAERLGRLPWVVWAEPDYVATVAHDDMHAPFTTGDSPIAAWNQPTLASCAIPAAWAQTTGSAALTIALLDTGVYTSHQEFSGHLVPGWDFVNGDGDPQDDAGHGTAMAGLIVGRGDDGLGLTGVAWGCKLMPIKVADWQGNASLSDLVSGILFAVDHSARILNVSLGSRVGSAALQDAVNYAWSHGALVVASVGNDNTNAALYPAAYPHVVAVGSTTASDDLGYVTNVSKLTTVSAPGEKLVSSMPGNFYRDVGGTSTSAALVSGVAALVWSKYPVLTNAQVRAAVQYGANPIPALAPVRSVFRFGKIDAVKALERASGLGIDVAVTRIECVPRRPMPGQAATVEVEIENQGVSSVSGVAVSATAAGVFLASPPPSVSLGAGERTLVSFPWTPGAAGSVTIAAQASIQPGETITANNASALPVNVSSTPDHAVQYADIGAGEPTPTSSALDFWYTVRNRGNVTENGVALRAFYNDAEFGSAALVNLAPGASQTVHFAWPVPSPTPADTISLVGKIQPSGYEPRPVEATGYYDFMLGSGEAKPVRSQYQQSGGIDVIPDAPYRVNAGRPYLPLLLFVPDKGSGDTLTALTIDDMKIWQKTAPEATSSGTLVYADSMSALPTAVPPGLVIVDELGAPQVSAAGAPDPNIFKDLPLDQRGRHAVLRIPREALGIPLTPAAPVVRYYWVTTEWSFNHHVMTWTPTSHGTTNKMLRVTFGSGGIAAVPLEGRFYDAHMHTITEWHYNDHLDVFSPQKAHGGPIQMIKECAYAVGMIDSPDDVFDKVVTSDHNCFFGSPLDPIPNSPLRRPPFGPTSVGQSLDPAGHVKSEFARMREVFGEACAEEVAFSQNTTGGPAPLPIGAHMLVYRAQHFDGTWHAGSDLSMLLHEGEPLYLETILSNIANTNPAENSLSFAYAAHPFSGQGWNDLNLNRTLGLLPLQRDHALVSLPSQKFVLKGLQFWNGRGPGSMPTDAIEFNNLNPFAHASFAGSANWDHGLQYGLRKWHEYLATDMDYNFVDEPGKKFPRKIYLEGGTDAHGDFNYSIGRLAAMVPAPSTFGVDSGAFGDTRTYAFGAGKPGATVEKRALAALGDGNSCATDGPVLYFDMDADGRFNSTSLKWHDASNVLENADGKMGGGGKFDGERTMLVRAGNPDLHFRYLWSNATDHGSAGGALSTIHIYKDQPGVPCPTLSRAFGGSVMQVIKGLGYLAPGAPGAFHSEPLNAAEEGLVTARTAYSLGGFTGGDPNVAPIGPNEFRAYTNPVWAVPVAVNVSVNTAGVTTASPNLSPGTVTVQFKFEGSMMPLPFAVHIKRLDAAGNSTDLSAPPLSTCSPLLTWQWDYEKGIADAVYTVKNDTAIPLTGANYPAAGKYSFVVYFKDAPKDLHGNALNSIAKTFTVNAPPPPPSKKCFVGALAGLPAAGPAIPGAPAALFLLVLAALARNKFRARH
ncbi:MAG: S8 family serine peptidase [Planctomycetes bacterium]|nr:S8 family serine peptidase [Planctomycetota bacterium]